jgi:hypothetical protein
MKFGRPSPEREQARREYRLRVAMGEPAARAASVLPAFAHRGFAGEQPAKEDRPRVLSRPRLRLIQGGDVGPRPRRPAIYIYGRGEDPRA